jgi:hypothetical protein
VYVPAFEHEGDKAEECYDIVEEIFEEAGKVRQNTSLVGVWNSVVGDKSSQDTAGPHGLGMRNQRGQMFIDFCERNRFLVNNTWFKKPKGRLYIWKAPGD